MQASPVENTPILTRLTIRQHPRLSGECDLTFSSGCNHLVGKNGVGKTTLLTIIAAILRDDTGTLASTEGPVDIEYCLQARHGQSTDQETVTDWTVRIIFPKQVIDRGNGRSPLQWHVDASVQCVASNSPPTKRVSMTIEGDATEDGTRWTYTPDWTMDVAHHPVVPPDPTKGQLLQHLIWKVSQYFDPHTKEEQLQPKSSAWLKERMSIFPKQRTCIRFDEALAYFSEIQGKSVYFPDNTLVGFSVIQQSAISINVPDDLEPQLSTPLELLLGRPTLSAVHAGNSPFLKQLVDILGVKAVTATPKLDSHDPHGETLFHGFRFEIRKHTGAAYPEDKLSFGEKRLLALLWYLHSNPNMPVVADEFANGLHAHWTFIIAESIQEAGRQAFFAAQNPLSIDVFEPPTDDEDAQRRFVLCTSTPDGWCWKNPSAPDAKRLMNSWNVGLQNLSELLQDQGLW